MSVLSDNVIPGNYGKIFGTNAIEDADLLEKLTAKSYWPYPMYSDILFY